MHRTVKWLAVTVCFLAAAAHTASAQAVRNRQGFWFSGGLGAGSLGCQDCDGRENGLSGGLAIGGTISQKVLLGVSSNGWTKSENGVTLTVGALAAVIRFYPSARGNFFLLGGLGIGSVDLQVSGVGSGSDTATAAILGLGYDFRLGSNVSLTPFWNGVALSNEDGDANFGQLGLGITIH